MDRKTLIIMTKSSKYHGNCVTGIDTESGKWIRLLTHDEQSHGAVPDILLRYADGTPLEVLDKVTAPIEEYCGDNLHPENYYLDEKGRFEKCGTTSFNEVLELHHDEIHKYVYANPMPFVDLEHIKHVDYSLCLIKVNDLTIYEQDYSLGKKKWKASFTYNDHEYKGIAMTDPKFYHSVSGTKYKVAYAVVSIGTPWDGRYYKYLSAIFVQKNTKILPDQSSVQSEQHDLMEINVEAHYGNGMAVFNNYESFKQELIKQLSVFKTGSYTVESMRDAVADRDQLKQLKNKLTEKRKEIEKLSNQPFKVVEDQLDELIELVKEPYRIIDEYIKKQEKRVKKDEIYVYARSKAVVLGELAEDLIGSNVFFNPRWLNASYSKYTWHKDIDSLIKNAQLDLQKIDELPEETIPIARTQYFETLSFSAVEKFIRSLNIAKEKKTEKKQVAIASEPPKQPQTQATVEDKNSAIFRVEGTKEQINNGYRLLRQSGLSVEVLSKS